MGKTTIIRSTKKQTEGTIHINKFIHNCKLKILRPKTYVSNFLDRNFKNISVIYNNIGNYFTIAFEVVTQ
ncbi:hypothetical protein [Anaeromicrobium sediminis]|uniref:Uncharacterized protein n=1 Tax=Anaeromicrobium sediminis TaxID=1478221 RepID=A0A267MP77_9FIRM|nr:hypothetical protein [Anaeromicrobium sediminis]PAB61401.1 hypothetical protein CCE28_02950 [Anaeromicrobium sediminis]